MAVNPTVRLIATLSNLIRRKIDSWKDSRA